MQSRMRTQLEAQEKAYQAADKKAAIPGHLSDSGDAFELAARCALGAWDARQSRMHTTEWRGFKEDAQFEIGYRIACVELAIVLRAIRKGAPPDFHEMRNVTREVVSAVKNTEERIPGEFIGLKKAVSDDDNEHELGED